MLKGVGVAILVVAVLGPVTTSKGCRDLRNSTLHLAYFPQRDMRHTVGIRPLEVRPLAPDSVSVPTSGLEIARDREAFAATFKIPVAADDSSIARGQRKFARTCVPCHGSGMAGNGPVAAKFVPPPDLLGPSTRGRSDGFIYYYVRHGGAIMPSYGAQVTAAEAYDLIHYIRHMQSTSPR